DSFSTVSTTSTTRVSLVSPVLGSISQRISFSLPYRALAAFWMASSIAEMTILRSMDFSRATASAICNSSSLLSLIPACAIPVMPPHYSELFRPICNFGRGLTGSGGPFGALQRLANEGIGEHEARLGDQADWQADQLASLLVRLDLDANLRSV